VGSGFAGSFHYEALRRVSHVPVRVAGVYSATPAHREAFAAKRGIKAFASFETMLAEVDVVDVCCPGCMHEAYTVGAAEAGRHVIVEKAFTGAYGPDDAGDDWRGDEASKEVMLAEAVASARRMVDAAASNNVKLMYAENWVYAPTVQKEVEIIRATKPQLLWMIGDESHSGSHSPTYGVWRKSGGGSLVGKGCHPLTAILYLKRIEGLARNETPIRPKTVSARMHRLTRLPNFEDRGFIRTSYYDIEDYCQVHIVFEDGCVADVFASELVLGGVHNWIEIFANNHRIRCNLNPTDALVLYNPREEQLKDVYLIEKLGTKQGWSQPAPDEGWASGYQQEMQDFMECVAGDRRPQSDGQLGADTVAVIYGAYVSDENHGVEVDVTLV
jgi:predicted dehydrogenase